MKRIICIFLAAILVCGMAVTASAATIQSTGFKDGASLALGHSSAAGGSLNLGTVVPNDEVEVYIYLLPGMFEWKDGLEPTVDNGGLISDAKPYLSASAIRSSKMTIRVSTGSGTKAAVKDISINTREGRIEAKFVTEHVSVKDVDFSIDITMQIDGKSYKKNGITLVGTLANDITLVYSGDDYVDTSLGQVAHAQDNIKDIEVDLGYGVSLFTKLSKNKKYYGTASRDPDQSDNVVFSDYPDVDNVISLKTVNLKSNSALVALATDYSGYYVYDANLKFIGMSNEMLPYSEKYYLANKELDVKKGGGSGSGSGSGSSGGSGDGDGDGDEDEPGGWLNNIFNNDRNPNTGIEHDFVKMAVLAAVLSLGAIGVIAKKKK